MIDEVDDDYFKCFFYFYAYMYTWVKMIIFYYHFNIDADWIGFMEIILKHIATNLNQPGRAKIVL